MIVDLSRRQTWTLGTEVTLDTNGESEAFEVDMDKIPKIVECFDDDTTDIQEEKGAAGGIPIMGISDNVKNHETNMIQNIQRFPLQTIHLTMSPSLMRMRIRAGHFLTKVKKSTCTV